jgi:hypothetical protein
MHHNIKRLERLGLWRASGNLNPSPQGDLDTRWEVSGQLHAPPALPLGNQPPVLIVYEVGWASAPVWMLMEKRKISILRWESNPSKYLVVQPVT